MKMKDDRFEISELFMATKGGDFNHCFYGTIKRGHDSDGTPKVWGKIDVNGTTVLSSAGDQQELGQKLDQIVLIVLEMGLHSESGNSKPHGKISLN